MVWVRVVPISGARFPVSHIPVARDPVGRRLDAGWETLRDQCQLARWTCGSYNGLEWIDRWIPGGGGGMVRPARDV